MVPIEASPGPLTAWVNTASEPQDALSLSRNTLGTRPSQGAAMHSKPRASSSWASHDQAPHLLVLIFTERRPLLLPEWCVYDDLVKCL